MLTRLTYLKPEFRFIIAAYNRSILHDCTLYKRNNIILILLLLCSNVVYYVTRIIVYTHSDNKSIIKVWSRCMIIYYYHTMTNLFSLTVMTPGVTGANKQGFYYWLSIIMHTNKHYDTVNNYTIVRNIIIQLKEGIHCRQYTELTT